MRNKRLFIVVDGPSASGKNSIIEQVLKDLKKLQINAVSIEETKEKSYNRKKILAAKAQGDKKVTETIIKERKKLYQLKILPQLLNGAIILANRGEPTTLGYQTLENHLTMEDVWNMHRKQNIPLPNLVILTNCSLKEAVRREGLRKASNEENDKNFMSGKFTGGTSRKKIHANYKKVKDFLEEKGLPVIYLNTDTMDIARESKRIVNSIKIIWIKK